MKGQELRKYNLPDTPGVYLFKKGTTIVYIGKATSLNDRVRSYFANDLIATRGPLIVDMVWKSDKFDFIETDSVLEALILEANLIKKHQPRYNTKEKDNKSFNYVVVTKGEFPRVLIIRGRELTSGMLPHIEPRFVAGPFPQGSVLKDAMKIVRKIFPFRDKCIPCEELKNKDKAKPCFNRQLGLCPGVCTGEISKKDYHVGISNLILFFSGKKKELVRKLKKEMNAYADRQEFEKAAKTKKTIFALDHIQDIALIKKEAARTDSQERFRIEAYDIAHLSGKNVVGVMTVIENGDLKKSDYRKFKIKQNPGVDDTGALKEILERRLGHPEWLFPNLIVIDGGMAQKNTAEKVLNFKNISIPVVSVVKDDRHKPKDILGDQAFVRDYKREILLGNAEAHRFAIKYHRKTRGF